MAKFISFRSSSFQHVEEHSIRCNTYKCQHTFDSHVEFRHLTVHIRAAFLHAFSL